VTTAHVNPGPVPALETRRLRLRPMRDDDLEPLLRVFGDPEAMAFYPAPFSADDMRGWIERTQDRYGRDGLALLTVERIDGEVIGDAGPSVQDVEGHAEIELGWHIRRDLWGRGYATEAARRLRDWLFGDVGLERLISLVEPGNVASWRVAEKVGMRHERDVDWHGRRGIRLYAMSRDDVRPGQQNGRGGDAR